MTVPAQNPRTLHTSDGETLVWAIGFDLIGVDTFGSKGAFNIRLFTEEPQTEDHPVYGTVDGSVELRRDVDYYVDVDAGEIELVEEVANGYTIAIIRDTFVTQECAYHELSRYLMDGSIEYPLDKITHRLQELTDLEARLVKWLASAKVLDFSWLPMGTYFPARLSVNNEDGTYDFVEIEWDASNDVWADKTAGRTGTAQEWNECPCVGAGVRIIMHALKATNASTVYRFRAALCDECQGDLYDLCPNAQNTADSAGLDLDTQMPVGSLTYTVPWVQDASPDVDFVLRKIWQFDTFYALSIYIDNDGEVWARVERGGIGTFGTEDAPQHPSFLLAKNITGSLTCDAGEWRGTFTLELTGAPALSFNYQITITL